MIGVHRRSSTSPWGRVDLQSLADRPFIRLSAPDQVPAGARNHFVGEVTVRTDAERNSEILIDIGHGKTLHSVMARDTTEMLDIRRGARVSAQFEANHVILAVR